MLTGDSAQHAHTLAGKNNRADGKVATIQLSRVTQYRVDPETGRKLLYGAPKVKGGRKHFGDGKFKKEEEEISESGKNN